MKEFNIEIQRIWNLSVSEGTLSYQSASISSVMKNVQSFIEDNDGTDMISHQTEKGTETDTYKED